MAAASAGRLRAAAAAATLRIGYASAAPGSDRNERQSVFPSPRTPRARVIVELELDRENQARTSNAHARRGPSPLFLAQYFAQETANAKGDAVIQSQAATRYPSLGFDQDILLPGSADAIATDDPRVDILV
ncbi:MAG: hypothetical protein HOL07_15290 [Rhodospirillaceae bacterium]|nr:hypothetical protein [Rhodospirillaceae bacterium]MBT5359704.1 hypothetical protein [Rhodospirillaceae bacterium]MBT5945827.1 hypothetical protein [Rhodospirillaceae bacterium]MBT6403359.1 hypothetical protein [Rhodospirillaceae bacterium]MBT7362278.1 hypothetical protein [Rhodospirillaceae bacterium]